jgi:hypothetical protein
LKQLDLSTVEFLLRVQKENHRHVTTGNHFLAALKIIDSIANDYVNSITNEDPPNYGESKIELNGEFITAKDEIFDCRRCGQTVNFQANCPVCNADLHHHINAVFQHFSINNDEEHIKYSPFRDLTIDDLADLLDITIKRDIIPKCITFLNDLNAQTEADQFNVMFAASSSTGKTYTAQQIAAYFPEKEIIEVFGASPTSFHHERGVQVVEHNGELIPLWKIIDPMQKELDEIKSLESPTQEQRLRYRQLRAEIAYLKANSKTLIDLENKILIFIDQPQVALLTKLRPFLSHDKKILETIFTDRASGKTLQTKHVIIKGFASVTFCTVAYNIDEQESTRVFMLSPEQTREKISESLQLLGEKLKDRVVFSEQLKENIKRRALKFRVELIRAYAVKHFRDSEFIKELFAETHEKPSPRSLRDIERVYALIHGMALLNCFNRKAVGDDTIETTAFDIAEAFKLYYTIMEATESGLATEIYELYFKVIKPAFDVKNAGIREHNANVGRQLDAATDPKQREDLMKRMMNEIGLTFRDISSEYYVVFGRLMSRKMKEDGIKALVDAGYLTEKTSTEDRRVKEFFPNR